MTMPLFFQLDERRQSTAGSIDVYLRICFDVCVLHTPVCKHVFSMKQKKSGFELLTQTVPSSSILEKA